ncbi:MAG: NAD(P)(+) transhydrogenase (Re/Si-specific) subunit beta [Candidatus Marinimicrobia bacterium]|nr:NAD(P)(+) transhydrogenase (Re/Si-specific) subunit beta [Candidatus Neomarinimicrobiota bacterium]MCF7840643.1 NAD(P)(+) transhydrogenase (Re/Si-specific) subunit beta [Candidatus Neomarinimicrobiota bacterium]
MNMEIITRIVYLVAAVFFILGLKNLSSPKTARRGNLLAMSGMLIAVIMTLFDRNIVSFEYIIIGLIVGGAIGAVAAKKVQMTSMPQMVALFNGFGGIASTLVAFAELYQAHGDVAVHANLTVSLSLLIGTVTFTGSLIAYAKLQGIMRGAPIVLPLHQILNTLLLIASVVLIVLAIMYPGEYLLWAIIIVGVAAIFGITFVIPIGGADMPVVISLLNSYSGIAAAMTGFVLGNSVLIIAGALVGASGLILTNIMCVAMNRSLTNVLFGAVGTDGGATASGEKETRTVTNYTPVDAAIMMEQAQSVIIVPGYGLAVAQAQHVLQEMAQILMDQGVKVRYAIHPVAGRMPGHMNVLMAEANVSYDLLLEMDAINDDFQDTDVALVIGANDVINPAARYKKDSPLYGMPILNVDQARTVMIVKRSLGAGFAGEANELFFDDKTMMIFGDAKKVVTDLVKTLKEE